MKHIPFYFWTAIIMFVFLFHGVACAETLNNLLRMNYKWGISPDNFKTTYNAAYIDCGMDNKPVLKLSGIKVNSYFLDAYYVFDQLSENAEQASTFGLSKVTYVIIDDSPNTEIKKHYNALLDNAYDIIGKPDSVTKALTTWNTNQNKIQIGTGKFKNYTGTDNYKIAIVIVPHELQNNVSDPATSYHEKPHNDSTMRPTMQPTMQPTNNMNNKTTGAQRYRNTSNINDLYKMLIFILVVALFVISYYISLSTKSDVELDFRNRVNFDRTTWPGSSVQQKKSNDIKKAKYDFTKIDRMDGHDFEYWCADLLRDCGYIHVRVTRGSGDQGVDIFAYKEGKKYAIQCKRHQSKLGNKAIQEVYTGMKMFDCDFGIVMTNNYFTDGGIEAARRTGVILWNRNKLKNMINSIEETEELY